MSTNRPKLQLGLIELITPGKKGAFSEIREIVDTDDLAQITLCPPEEFLELSVEMIYEQAV
jgi:hypothetical protein